MTQTGTSFIDTLLGLRQSRRFLAQPIASPDPRVQPFNMDWSEKDRWG